MRSANLLDSRKGRFFTFGTLYISEGIPYGFSSIAMVTFMRIEGLSLDQIGVFAAAILLPWGFKWAWAPLIDIVTLARFGGRKAWIVGCLSLMIITLATMATVDFVEHFELLIWLTLLNNLFGATQDVAIDSLAVSTLKEDERGTGNGFMFGGQYFGITLGGGIAIYISSLWGFNASLLFVSAFLVLNLLFVIFFIYDPAIESSTETQQSAGIKNLIATLKIFFDNLRIGFLHSGSGPKIGLLFAILPVGAMALAYAIMASLRVDYGFDESAIARIAIVSTVCAGAGCLIGGALGDKYGIKNMLALSYFMTMIPTVYLAAKISALGLSSVSIEAFYAVTILHGLFFGAAFAQHAAIFMGMTNPLVAATQFTAYMAISNLAISMGNYWQGMVAEKMGYAAALYIDALLVVACLGVIPFLKNREEDSGRSEVQPVPAVG